MKKCFCISKDYTLGTASRIDLEREITEDFTVHRILMNPIVVPPSIRQYFMITGGWMVACLRIGRLIVKDDDGHLEDAANYSPLSKAKAKFDHYMRAGELVKVGILYNGHIPRDFPVGMSMTFSVTLRS